MNQIRKIRINWFVAIALLSGWIGVLVDSILGEQREGESLGMGLWLVLPMLTVAAFIVFSSITWKEIGLRLNFRGNAKWYWLAASIFPAVTGFTVLTGKALGWVETVNFDLNVFVSVFFSLFLFNFIKNIFEETVWRGFLTSQLVKLKLDDWKIYLVVGLVWGLWHVPYYMVFLPEEAIYAVLPTSRTLFTFVAVITMLAWTVMFVELYRVTGSIWPCVLLRAVEDALVNPLVISGYIQITAGKELLVSPICGIIPSLFYLGIGLVIRTQRRRGKALPFSVQQSEG